MNQTTPSETTSGTIPGTPLPSALPAAVPVRRRRLPLAWLLPLLGLGVVGYFVWWTYTQNQPNVELRLDNASGIKAFQTPVLCRGVEVGSVTDVQLDPTGGGATVLIRLNESGLPLATPDAAWWVIRPEFSITDVSGIESLLAGPSIAYRPGVEAPRREKSYTALAGPPPDAGMSGGLRVFLTSDARSAIEPGTPVRFRGVPIGRVVSMRLPTHGQSVVFIAEIDLPFAHLIRDNSVFWHRQRAVANVSRLALGLEGYEIDFPRLNSALKLNIDVATPDSPGQPIAADTVFELKDLPPNNYASWAPDLTLADGALSGSDHEREPLLNEIFNPTTADDSDPDTPQKPDPIGDLFNFINPFD